MLFSRELLKLGSQLMLSAVYYRDDSGVEPVNAFINGLGVKRQVALDNQIQRLNMLTPDNPHLPFPYSSQVRGELRELRCHYGSTLYRILFRRSDNLIVLLHIFVKKTKQVPQADIDIAELRWDDFKRRMDAEPRRKPRAAGSDAP